MRQLSIGGYTLKIYKDDSNEWRYSIWYKNGKIIDASTEGYKNYDDLISNMKSKLTALELFDKALLNEEEE